MHAWCVVCVRETVCVHTYMCGVCVVCVHAYCVCEGEGACMLLHVVCSVRHVAVR